MKIRSTAGPQRVPIVTTVPVRDGCCGGNQAIAETAFHREDNPGIRKRIEIVDISKVNLRYRKFVRPFSKDGRALLNKSNGNPMGQSVPRGFLLGGLL